MAYSPKEQKLISELPLALRDDLTTVNYILEMQKQTRDTSQAQRDYAHHLKYNEGTPEEILGRNIVERLQQNGVKKWEILFIARVLPRADIDVALQDEQIPLNKYICLAKIRRMPPEKLLSYTNDYEIKPEHMSEARACSSKWTKLERSLLAWNLGLELGRAPTEQEIESRLADEILQTGNSHSKRCRAFCYLAHPEWFQRKQARAVA